MAATERRPSAVRFVPQAPGVEVEGPLCWGVGQGQEHQAGAEEKGERLDRCHSGKVWGLTGVGLSLCGSCCTGAGAGAGSGGLERSSISGRGGQGC